MNPKIKYRSYQAQYKYCKDERRKIEKETR